MPFGFRKLMPKALLRSLGKVALCVSAQGVAIGIVSFLSKPGKIKNNSCIAYALGSLGLLRKMVDGRMARFNEFMPSRLVRIVREEIDEALHEIKSARFYKFASSTDIVQCKICLMSARSMMAKYVLPPELQL
jgi:hypothetical protein